MRILIAFGGKVQEVQTKKTELSIDGTFLKITDFDGNEMEISPNNVLIIHEKGERKNVE